ncbi:hypothetical protein BOTBODRAFT_29109 [Botryobasidium botryosum FD-172 SS1]|uniref:RNI-like protein n=1 Tax=Botryobasidium botryosum (strain FD-172 SS1) TaxID=930990 RepID=A0A067MSL6_BOTB1|nr:hypothetical protein BOTBODRAFT_29109 [Botryobasidium botryosum FD-172 SS1]
MARGAGNNVRGPTSALTSFLREQGINTGPISIYNSGRIGSINEEEEENESAGAGPSQGAGSGRRGRGRAARATLAYNSADVESSDEETEKPTTARGKKRKLEEEKAKAKAKLAAKKRKRVDDEDEEYVDEYTAPSKGVAVASDAPEVGSSARCADCDKKFTVTRYTLPADPPPGYLCHACAKESGADPFKKPAAPRRRKPAQDKRKIVNFDQKDRVKTLAQICISILGQHIDDVEALGDIGSRNMDAISMILAKNRSLTAENVQLFYDVRNTSLTLYDATSLQSPALCTLASLNPKLERLRINYCGRMDNVVLEHWTKHLTSLHSLDLLGPFLVRAPAWEAFFNAMKDRLRSFLIVQSPRFDTACLAALATNCATTLTELRLCEVGKMEDTWLPTISTFEHLTFLDLSYPATSLTDEPVAELLKALGASLTSLNLSGNEDLTDAFLLEGVRRHTPSLTSLTLANLPALTDLCVAEFFSSYTPHPPLQQIDLSRSPNLSSKSLAALLSHSGSALTSLSINSWKETSNAGLMAIPEHASQLVKIDFGFCREVDDFVMKAIIDGCPELTEIKCFGCNKVTTNCPRKLGVSIKGVEAHATQ